MTRGCLAARLGSVAALTDAERIAVEALPVHDRTVLRGAQLVRQKDPAPDPYVIRRGLLSNYVLLDNGNRQILRILFPGDVGGMSGFVQREAPEGTVALTTAEITHYDKPALIRLFARHPRIAALMLALEQVENVALNDRLAALARRPAKSRVAALLLDMRARYRRAGIAGEDFVLGLTQEEIGDATGLTAVHVNRMLRQLEDERLIARQAGRMRILDERALNVWAHHVDRYEGLDLGWLPPAA